MRIIECVPNFSEGKDAVVIEKIAASIRAVSNVKLLHIDSGAAANRTVYTFAGEPEQVVEAAFQAIKTAGELIDMREQKGEHPRIGATDVCPLIPIANVSMEECIALARKLSERVGNELGIPVYCYEHAAFEEKRKNLANCRSGEYEGLKDKMQKPEWKPDFGPSEFNERVAFTGASVIGARDFLIAINFNLNTNSAEIAQEIAMDVRQKGRPKRNSDGTTEWIPGTLKGVKAIGWYIEEFGIAQVSMNINDFSKTAPHEAFEEVSRQAEKRGVKVTGTELIGLIPKKCMLDAGVFYLQKQNKPTDILEKETIETAIKSMHFDDLKSFNPEKKIIEYVLEKDSI